MRDGPTGGVIGFRTAMLCYAGLAIAAALTLKEKLLYLALIVLAAFAVKTYLHHLRDRLG